MAFKQSSPDPRMVPVQINVTVPWHYREHLREKAKELGISNQEMLRKALFKSHPPPKLEHLMTREAGATS